MKALILAAIVLAFDGCALFRQELPPWARPMTASVPVVTSDAPESVTLPPPITEPAAPSTVQEATLPADPPVAPPIGPPPTPE